jgi:hypothetical protein
MRTSLFATFVLLGALVGAPSALAGQGIPTPLDHFGFELGEDRKLANWTELSAWYDLLALRSPRVAVDTLGATTMGRPFVMLTITSPENHARLEELHDIQSKLSDPRTVSGRAELERLLERGKAVVLITHAIHSTEVGSAQTAARLAHRMATSDDPKILEILDEVVLLHIPNLNPDGTEWVVDWYNEHVGGDYEGGPMPWLYQYYIGHDNNRDWYGFTQKETELAITGAHNAWHPHIVHDIHQMGNSGARIFFPPYIDPIEPNVDPGIVTALNQLGAYMAAELTAEGKRGAVINAIYDAFTPARAYQHYHGGIRILSETASARIATPISQTRDEMRGGREYDAARASWNYPSPWEGGEWGLPDIVDYMESGALALLTNAAKNRRFWMENFFQINLRAVRGWERWPEAWVIPAGQENVTGVQSVLRILTMGDVEVHRAEAAFEAGGERFPAGSWVVPMRQPWASFAQTLLEHQEYPDLREYPGGPPKRPYDVTAHTLPLLMDVRAVPVTTPLAVSLSDPVPVPEVVYEAPPGLGEGGSRFAMYKSWQEPMEAGWTRWVLDQHPVAYDTLKDADIRAGGLRARYDAILLQSQSAESIREGWSAVAVPEQYAGGIGEEGERALRDFVRAGGRLVVVEEATDFAMELFDLRMSNAVDRLPPQDFYIPGSILRLELEGNHPVAAGVDEETMAWYWRSSRAFDVRDPSLRVVARYGEDPLLSGWILGAQHVAGKPAIVEARVGSGSVVLFGFQPNYRGQSIATWPLLFNALAVAPVSDADAGVDADVDAGPESDADAGAGAAGEAGAEDVSAVHPAARDEVAREAESGAVSDAHPSRHRE